MLCLDWREVLFANHHPYSQQHDYGAAPDDILTFHGSAPAWIQSG